MRSYEPMMQRQQSVTPRELALWMHMVALELRKAKVTGVLRKAGTYAKRLIDEGHSDPRPHVLARDGYYRIC